MRASPHRALLPVAVLLLAAPGLPPAAPFVFSPAPSAPIAESRLLDGDLVFRRGRDMMAATVLAAGQATRFSHVGLFLRVDGRAMIVHAVPAEHAHEGGVVIEPLAVFLAADRAADHEVRRVAALDDEGRVRVRAAALTMLGRPFDFDFSYASDAQLYCSELVMKALAAGGADLRPGLATVQSIMLSEPAIPPDALRLRAGVGSI